MSKNIEINNPGLGHNQPPKINVIAENIKKRQIIKANVLKQMRPRVKDGAYIATQISDALVPGFVFMCSSPGVHNAYFIKGKTKIKLGTWNGVAADVERFRQIAADMNVRIIQGHDPKAVLEERLSKKNLKQLYDKYIEEKLDNLSKSDKENFLNRFKVWINHDTEKKFKRMLIRNNYTALSIGNKLGDHLTKNDLLKAHRVIAKHYPYQANRLLEDIRRVFVYAKDNNLIENNVATFKKAKDFAPEPGRLDQGILPYSEDQISRFKKVCVKNYKDLKLFVVSKALLLALYLGWRYKSEVFSLKWSQINLEAGVVYFKNIKNHKTITAKLNDAAIAVLQQMRSYKDKPKHALNIPMRNIKSRYVFPTFNKSTKPYIQDVRKSFKRICKAADIPVKPIYMLRHSCWTIQDLDLHETKEMGMWKTLDQPLKYKAFTDDKKTQTAKQMSLKWANI